MKVHRLPIRVTAALCAIVAVNACVSHTIREVDMTPPERSKLVQDENDLLDLGFAVLDPNVPEGFDAQQEQIVFADIRRAEAVFIPYFAKNLLQSTGNWGAVRVVPRPTHAVDLSITGKIIESDGERLTLDFTVTDARGIEWFTKRYHALASKYAYDDTVPADIDAFQAIYNELADDMLAYRESLDAQTVREIRGTAEMRFAREFAPDAFATHVNESSDGEIHLLRLPADDDPMLARVRNVREREYLFIDTLDEYYASFHRNMYTPYQEWRATSYNEAIAYRKQKNQARARAWAGGAAIVGGIAAIYESSDAYVDASGLVAIMSGATLLKSAISKSNEAAMQAEVLQEIGIAAEADILPHVIEVENQTVSLQGTVDEQYEKLRHILRRVYFEDLGIPAPLDLPDTAPR